MLSLILVAVAVPRFLGGPHFGCHVDRCPTWLDCQPPPIIGLNLAEPGAAPIFQGCFALMKIPLFTEYLTKKLAVAWIGNIRDMYLRAGPIYP